MSIYESYSGYVLRVVAVVLIPVAVFFVPSLASAGVLAVDANAMEGWCGTQHFEASLSSPSLVYLSADIDYAVYAPGQFDKSFSGKDPSNGDDYVYAYQIYTLGTSSAYKAVKQLTVGLDGNETLGEVGYLLDLGMLPTSAPTFQGTPPTSALYSYNSSPYLPRQQCSTILIFTSGGPPEFDSGDLLGQSLLEDTQLLPSPGVDSVPEPTMLVLLVGAVATFLGVHLARR